MNWYSLGRQVIKRLVEAVMFLFLLITALFFLIRLNGNPAQVLAGPNATQAQVKAVEQLYGFNRPLVLQYLDFMRQFASFHFGNSIQERTSALAIAISHAWKTLLLCSLATICNVAISTPLGLFLGKRQRGNSTRFVYGATIVAQGVQFYIVGMILVAIFAVHFHVFPATGSASTTSWVLPTLTLAWLVAPRLTRVVASAAAEVWSSEYARTAHAFGMPGRKIWWRTIAPNVAVPLIATAGTQFTLLISGAVIIEGLFGIAGLGQTLIQAVGSDDFPIIAASVTIIGVIVFCVTTISDLLYQLVDPRLRRQGTS